MDRPFVDPLEDAERFDPYVEQLAALALARLIAERRGVAFEDLQPSGTRKRGRMGDRRHAALAELCAALRALPYGWSYPKIGRFVGRHHTTIMHALRAKRAQ
jgi:chromosomal replication initiation ATPase DnaA